MTAVATEEKNFLNLHSVDGILRRLEHRKNDRHTVQVADPSLLNLQYRKADGKSTGAFVIRPKAESFKGPMQKWFDSNGEMELSENAVKSILKHGGISLPEKLLPGELPRLATLALRGKMNEFHGLNMLTRSASGIGKRVVDAFIPGKVNAMADYDLISQILERLGAQYKDKIKGIRLQSEYSEARQRYWVVFGNPVIDEKADDHLLKTYPMLDIETSDIGLGGVELTLGLMRIICVNGALRTDWEAGRARWNRSGNGENFMDQVKSVISVAGQFASNMHDCLTTAIKTDIDLHGLEIVKSLHGRGIMNSKQADVAEMIVKRDDPMSEYDMFQVATESAQALKGNQRRRAESLAMNIMVAQNGFSNVARNGMEMRAFNKNTRGDAE